MTKAMRAARGRVDKVFSQGSERDAAFECGQDSPKRINDF